MGVSFRKCSHCGGTGQLQIGQEHQETLDSLVEHGPRSVTELAKLMGLSYHTVNARLNDMEKLEVVSSRKIGRKRTYYAPGHEEGGTR